MGATPQRHLRRVLATSVGVGLLAAPFVAVPASAADAQADTTTLNLVNINDFHGRIDENTVKFAGTVEQLRAKHPDSTAFLSAGDNIGASLFASSTQDDKPTLDVLNALGLQASSTGNHEYDKGVDDLTGRVKSQADFPYLAANVTKDGQQVHEPSTVIDVDGVKIGIVAAVTQETPTLVSPGGIAGLKFGDPVAAVNAEVKKLKDGDEANGEADVVVAEYHEGAGAGTPDGADLATEVAAGGAFAKIVTQTSPDVDVIFTGHTHKEYAWQAEVPGESGKTRPVVQTGSYGENLGHVVLDYDSETDEATATTVENVARTETDDAELVATYPAVAKVKTIVDDALAVAEEKGSVKVGEATADITTAFADGKRDDRASESTLGNLVADSLLATLSSEERGGANIGVVNPGGLRSDLAKGDITYAQANAVLPFVNNLWTTTLTGAQFKEALEQQWQLDENGEVPSRPYLQLGLSKNVSYTFDEDAEQGEHITSVTVNGEPLDPAKDYTIGSFSFLLQGGDNFRAFADGKDTKDTGLIDRDAWIDYLEANQPVAPDFARRAVAVKGLPTDQVKAGSSIEVTLPKLDLTSKGSPANTEVVATLEDSAAGAATRAAGPEIGSATVTDGAATVKLTIPEDAEGDYQVKFTADPTGTTAALPLKVTAAEPSEPSTDPTTEAPTEAPSEGPSETAAPSDEPSTEAPSEAPSSDTGADSSETTTEAAAGHGSSGDLASTGSDATGWIAAGVIAVLLGAVLTVLSIRRKH